jgi:hypothetical protein
MRNQISFLTGQLCYHFLLNVFIVRVTETLLLQQTVGASFFPSFLFFAHPSHPDLERTLGPKGDHRTVQNVAPTLTVLSFTTCVDQGCLVQ